MREFPPFRLDTVNQCLWRGDGAAEERVLLAPKAFDVLRYLVEHPGRLVAHDELLEALWPKTYVQPEVLKSRSEEHTSELQSPCNLVCRLLLEKKKKNNSRKAYRCEST